MENIDTNNKKVLSAIHSSGSFFCCEWEHNRLLKTFKSDVAELSSQSEFIHIGSVAHHTALVPTTEYNSDSNFAYLHLMSRITNPEQWTVQHMNINKDIVMVSGENLGDHHDQLISYTWTHSDAALLYTCMAEQINSSSTGVYLDVYDHVLSIWIVLDGRLHFHNNFYVTTPEDLMYYVALVYQQNDLDLNADALFLSGHIVEGSAYFDIIHKYVRNYSFWNLGLQSSDKEPNHIYNRSYAIALCV